MLQQISLYAVPLILLLIPLTGVIRRLPVYELFVEGAAEGIKMALQILPYLLAMLMAIAVFRASGAFDALAGLLTPLCDRLGLPPEVLPLGLMRPLSGSGALALTADVINEQGPDSFAGLLASVMQGSTDTTFYILSVYFGSVGVRQYRYALGVGLSADLVSFISSFIVCSILFASYIG
jgi:spore maturation protein B